MRRLKDKQTKFHIKNRETTIIIKQVYRKRVKGNQETGVKGHRKTRINSVNKFFRKGPVRLWIKRSPY